MKGRVKRGRRGDRNGEVGADARGRSADRLARRFAERVEGGPRLGTRKGDAGELGNLDRTSVGVVGVPVGIRRHLHFVIRPHLLFARCPHVAYELRVPVAAVCVAQHLEWNAHRHGVAVCGRRPGRFPVRRVARVLRRELVVRAVRRRVELVKVAADAVGPEIDPDFVVVALPHVVGVLLRGDRLVLRRVETHVERVAVGRDVGRRRLAGRLRLHRIPRKRQVRRLRPRAARRLGIERRIRRLRDRKVRIRKRTSRQRRDERQAERRRPQAASHCKIAPLRSEREPARSVAASTGRQVRDAWLSQ